MTSRTYLDVPPTQATRARSAGAVWDPDERRYYVPPGSELVSFEAWLPAVAERSAPTGRALARPDTRSTDLAVAAPRGIPLSALLRGVAKAVSDAYAEGAWTRVEVANVKIGNGHVYLELAERDAGGSLIAKATGTIWASTASRVLPEFEKATGATLAPGIKLLVRARPTFKPSYGFSLDIDAIDPTYTLGDLEAKKREIRALLRQADLWGRQAKLTTPWDYNSVLVVAPEGAAGLGDFLAEARRLQEYRICRFRVEHARFQGEGAPAEIIEAIRRGLARWADSAPDAVVVIRGGGATNDLAWLNDLELAKLICELPVPVLAGIGHERDSTMVDEVAHRSFDTPSKVIAGIEQVIRTRCDTAAESYQAVLVAAQRASQRAGTSSRRLMTEIEAAARNEVASARAGSAEAIKDVREGALQRIGRARTQAQALMHAVQRSAESSVVNARAQSASAHQQVLERACSRLGEARTLATAAMTDVEQRAAASIETARQGAQALIREITGQGPAKTLARGFAMVTDSSGAAVTRAAAATGMTGEAVVVSFADGTVPMTIEKRKETE